MWKVGTIEGFRGSWDSGMAELVIDGQAIPCDNARTARALEALFGGVMGPGHTVNLKAIVGQQVAYRTGDFGLLEGLAPAEAVESLNRRKTARQRRHRRLA